MNDLSPNTPLDANALSFIGLSREYCEALETCAEAERNDFVEQMLRLLPRLYITATDLRSDPLFDDEDAYIEQALEEDYYESVRRNIEGLLGPDDVYLEVFEEEMKYSDTPVAVSIAESLADIFQVLYNFISAVRSDATDETVALALASVRADFHCSWSRTLCNVLRALNALAME